MDVATASKTNFAFFYEIHNQMCSKVVASSPVFPLFRDCLWFKDINEMSARWSRYSGKPGKDHHATDVTG